MARSSAAWRKQVLDACQLLASYAQERGAAVHVVQRMMADPEYRAEVQAAALERAQPREGALATATKEYQRVQAAADKLRGYKGRVL